jgi:uncharacterized protein (TIGR02268 family)
MAHFLSVLLTLVLLVSTMAAAQPGAAPCESGLRRIELRSASTGEVPALCISPEQSTTFVFEGAELLPEGVTLEGRERFSRVEVSATMLRLVPSARVVPAERLELIVRFKDGAAPASAAFWLWVYPGQGTSLVEVYRDKRTRESCERQVKEQQEQLLQCREENARLGVGGDGPMGLIRLLAEGFMNDEGIQSKKLGGDVIRDPGNVASVTWVRSYRSASRVAVELELGEAGLAQPWRAVGARLMGEAILAPPVLHVWQKEPPAAGLEGRRLVVEAEAGPAGAQGRFLLQIWGEDRKQRIVLTGVTFP